jgi:hypothetical protein
MANQTKAVDRKHTKRCSLKNQLITHLDRLQATDEAYHDAPSRKARRLATHEFDSIMLEISEIAKRHIRYAHVLDRQETHRRSAKHTSHGNKLSDKKAVEEFYEEERTDIEFSSEVIREAKRNPELALSLLR